MSEAIIDPTRPIIDTHHHFSDRAGHRYLFHDLLNDLNTGHNFIATIYIENRVMIRAEGPEWLKPVGETEFANGIAAMSASGKYGPCRVCAGIVSYADLRDDRLEDLLDEHVVAGRGRFRGIRQVALWHSNPEVEKTRSYHDTPQGLLLDPTFRRGYRKLMKRGHTFDATIYHTQLPELADLLKAIPEGTAVLDHLGIAIGIAEYAGRRDEVFATWKKLMRQVAEAPNLILKIGGLGMPFWGFGFNLGQRAPSSDELAAAWAPYVETAIEIFGPERCMFGSNFPPDRHSCTFDALWNALKKIVSKYSDSEKAALFSGTAAKTYKLDAFTSAP